MLKNGLFDIHRVGETPETADSPQGRGARSSKYDEKTFLLYNQTRNGQPSSRPHFTKTIPFLQGQGEYMLDSSASDRILTAEALIHEVGSQKRSGMGKQKCSLRRFAVEWVF